MRKMLEVASFFVTDFGGRRPRYVTCRKIDTREGGVGPLPGVAWLALCALCSFQAIRGSEQRAITIDLRRAPMTSVFARIITLTYPPLPSIISLHQ